MSTEYGHILKLGRAKAHLEDLNSKVSEWLDTKPYAPIITIDPEDGNYFIYKVSAVPVPGHKFSAIVGDIIQNLRSSLDHIVFSLAEAYTKPITDQMAKDSQFPIVGDNNSKGVTGHGKSIFMAQRKRRIGALNPRAQAIIRGFQPYRWQADFRRHPLWILNELSNIDKHRFPHLVMLTSAGWRVASAINGADVEWFPDRAIMRDTVVMRVRRTIFKDSREMNTDLEPIFTIGFQEGPIANRPFTFWFNDTYELLRTVFFPKLEKFL